MLTEPLPTALDVRRAAVREAAIRGVLKPADLARFRPLLAEDEGRIEVDLAFSRDEEGRYVIRLGIEADVVVTCQRCLHPMPEHLSCDTALAVVWTDQQAAALPRHLEPLVVEEPSCNLWDVVEEELILALPQFSYHDSGDCRETLAAYREPPPGEEAGESRPNPFDVLAQLRPGEET